MYPGQYPAVPAVSPGKTREQVPAELDAAIRAGEVPLIGLATAREDFPAEYPMAEPARDCAYGSEQPHELIPTRPSSHG
ncbi:hypothetical protein SBBP1_1390002 [Burkholderiales bacterium]|nr:hypothetical protein SBBP1_1390002 [Burkholderiales bacterium]